MKDKSRPSRLAVLSVDGMRPDFYRRPEEFGLKIPNLLELVKRGASAEAVESVYPTTTYPAHATLVTGVPPSVHGIYSHLASLDPTEKARPWCWFAGALRVPTLWDVVRASGRKAAAISWPVSAAAAIDYNIPEIWDP
ncbi:MAG: alkaline phosphatase family protein, partial [Terriglobia bacterium]